MATRFGRGQSRGHLLRVQSNLVIPGPTVPPWVPANSIDFYDFQNDRAYVNGAQTASSTSPLSVSRASSGYDLLATILFGPNVARRTGAGLLVEAARTNLDFPSATFTDAAYVKTSLTATQNSTAPDGTANSGTTLAATANAVASIYKPNTITGITSGSTVAITAFMKAGTTNFGYIQINSSGDTAAFAQFFNLSSGIIGTFQNLLAGYGTVSADIKAAGNGWFRVSLVFANINTGLSVYFGIPPADGNRTSVSGQTLGLYGAQVEIASNASSYIPTTTAAATRTADNITVPVSAGTSKIDLTFDDNSTQLGITAAPGNYQIPNCPAGRTLKFLRSY